VLLPDGRGYALAERASALGIKTILMSGHPDEIETLGRVMYLAKPFRIEEFKRIIAEQLSDVPVKSTFPKIRPEPAVPALRPGG
jgi:hypothetical protein